MTINFAEAAKSKQLNAFFQQHGRIYIVVDATQESVDVPTFLKGDPALRLVINTRMPQSIHINDDALISDFSFSGQNHHCHIPMQHIWAAYQPEGDIEQGLVWEDSVPESIRMVVNAARNIQKTDDSSSESETAPTHIEDNEPKEKNEVKEEKESKPQRKVRHLRIIK